MATKKIAQRTLTSGGHSLQERLAALESHQTDTAAHIADLESRLHALGKLSQRVSDLESQTCDLDAHLADVETRLVDLKGRIKQSLH